MIDIIATLKHAEGGPFRELLARKRRSGQSEVDTYTAHETLGVWFGHENTDWWPLHHEAEAREAELDHTLEVAERIAGWRAAC